MKNVLELLERHLQWFFLGLAAIYLAYMTWSYVISSPITATLDGKEVTPANIARETLDGPADKLNREMGNTKKVDFEVREYVTPFTNRINKRATTPPFELAKVVIPSYAGVIIAQGVEVTPDRPKCTELVVAPKPEIVGITSGASNVVIQEKTDPAKPASALDKPKSGVDKFWASIGANISVKSLADEYERTNLTKQRDVPKTALLLVELERQEMQANGQWGPSQPVKPLIITRVKEWPDNKNRAAQLDYDKWAMENAGEIQFPPFHVIQIGDTWKSPLPQAPGAASENTTPITPPLPTIDRKIPPPPGIPNDLRLRWQQEHKKYLDEQKAKNNPTTRRAAPPPRFFGSTMGVDGNGLRIQYAQVPGGGPPGSGGRPAMSDMDREGYEWWLRQQSGNPDRPGQPNQPQPPGTTPPQPAGVPLGGFVPITGMQDIQLLAHDDSVEPGKTYQYRLRYRLRNPLFATKWMANPQTLADQFDITSPFSEWTSPVSIFETTNFAVAGGVRRDQGRADFNIYRWQAGRWNKTKVTRNPGDSILDGSAGGGPTFIDIRQGDREDYLLIVMPDGTIIRRSYLADMQNPDLQKLNKESDRPATPVDTHR